MKKNAAMEKLPKNRRLHGRDCLGALFQEGSRGAAGKIAARALPNGTGETRIAAVAGKSLGKAAKRSRMRRLIRAAFRMQQERLPAGWDFALVARPGLLESQWQDVMRDLATAMQRAVRDATESRRPKPHA